MDPKLAAALQSLAATALSVAEALQELGYVLDTPGELGRRLEADAIIAIAKRRAGGNLDPI